MKFGAHIWIEGIIGAGKTTVTRKLADELNLRPLFEPVEANPYLDDFYKNPKEHAFAMQIELMAHRYAMQQLAAYEACLVGGYNGSILDRGLPGDRVFAKLHMKYGNMSELNWNTYQRLFNIMCSP